MGTIERVLRLLCSSLCLALAGCITTPLPDRDWIEVRSAHYDLVSSLGEHETARLARDVERFRSAAEYIWGRELPAEPLRTRIYAFDDRGIERPFNVQSLRGYLLPRPRGDLLVLRTGGGWDDTTHQLRLEYARRLFGNAASRELPPWYPEGLAQLASTLQIRGAGVDVGILRDDHVRTLLREPWLRVERVLAARDLDGWSDRDRAMFEAEAWALAHYLKLSEERRGRSAADFSRFLELLASGAPPDAAARSAFGVELHRAVWTHVSAREIDSIFVRIRNEPRAQGSRALSRREILKELGELSLALERDDQAERYFERARELDPDSARTRADLGTALASEVREPEAARALLEPIDGRLSRHGS